MPDTYEIKDYKIEKHYLLKIEKHYLLNGIGRWSFIGKDWPVFAIGEVRLSEAVERFQTFTMLPKLKALWLEGLRSGKFKQGKTGKLSQIHPTFESEERLDCCLGVYCILREVPSEEVRVPNGDVCVLYAGEAHYLPNYLQLELPRPIQYFFASLNDAGFTFEQIAEIVEALL